MRRLLIAALIVGVAVPTIAIARSTTVRATVRKDGTYVPSHVRTTPNRTKLDNYSTKPNVNPRTGKAGTIDPYKWP